MTRQRVIFGLLTVWSFLVVFPLPAEARVIPITLKKLVDRSDLIVMARETKVEDGPADLNLGEEASSPIKVATARVLEVLKGKAGPEVRYIASPTWTCDISKAKPGERVVLFLSKSEHEPFMMIEHSGRGRMPIREVNGKQQATIWVDDVELPRWVYTVPGPDHEYSSIRTVDVNELKWAVQRASGLDAMAIGLGVIATLVASIIVLRRRTPRKQTTHEL